MQQGIDANDQQQRTEEQHHAGKAVQEALPCLVAKVIGDQRQHHDADDVGGKRNRHDQDRQRDVAEQRVAMNDVEVEQAKRFEGK